jgi:ADP-ribose pyrophosphatase YjhB (NUDIX family)
MDDLIKQANSYAQKAGRTQDGQRLSAVKIECISQCLMWVTAGIGAIVGTSIFADWIEKSYLPFAGILLMLSAVLSAIQATSKLDERAEAHRIAAATYGGIRRRADLLKLRLKGDASSREKGFTELDKIGSEFTELAKQSTTRALAKSVYEEGKKQFEEGHPQYFSNPPTHAGGVVIRKKGDTLQYLVVQAKGKPHEWVLPKGHIRHGESLEQTARREVMEESGVETSVRQLLDTIEFSTPKEAIRSAFFLMDAVQESSPREGREQQWLDFDNAMQKLRYKESQWLVFQANFLLQQLNNIDRTIGDMS